jgi:hypothetical protein
MGLTGAILLAFCLATVARGQGLASPPNLVVLYGDAGVTIVAKSVPLRSIVQEWARLGDVRLINLRNVPMLPVTVELREMPEAAALKVLLRSLPGYFLQQRGQASAGSSAFDKLVVMEPPSQSSLAHAIPAGLAGDRTAQGTPQDDASGDASVDLMSPPPGIAPPADGAVAQTPASPPRGGPATLPAGLGQARPGPPAAASSPKGPGVVSPR